MIHEVLRRETGRGFSRVVGASARRPFVIGHFRCSAGVSPRRTLLVVGVLSALALGVPSAEASARSCRNAYAATSPAAITSVRNLTCRAAVRYYDRHHGGSHVSLHRGGHFRIGNFACVTYADLTPPGPSDSYVLARCVRGVQAFRFEYGP